MHLYEIEMGVITTISQNPVKQGIRWDNNKIEITIRALTLIH